MYDFRWITWNVDHIARHGVSPDEAEYVVQNARRPFPRRVDAEKRLVWGQTADGTYLQVIYLGRALRHPRHADDRPSDAPIPARATQMKQSKSKSRWYSRMTPAALEAMAAPFDLEIDYAETKPLTPAMRKAETAARRKKPGRPKVGLGAEKLRISMEKGLLKRVDAYAKARGMTRWT